MKFLATVSLEGFDYDSLVCVVATDERDAQMALIDTYNALGHVVTDVRVVETKKFPPLAAVINAIS